MNMSEETNNNLLMKAIEKGFYTGMFNEEIPLSFLEQISDYAYSYFKTLVDTLRKNNYREEEIVEHYPTLVRNIHNIKDIDKEKESDRIMDTSPSITDLYMGTCLVYVREVYKQIKNGDTINVRIKRFKVFYWTFLTKLSTNPFVSNTIFFQPSKYIERKMVFMDALRYSVDKCTDREVTQKSNSSLEQSKLGNPKPMLQDESAVPMKNSKDVDSFSDGLPKVSHVEKKSIDSLGSLSIHSSPLQNDSSQSNATQSDVSKNNAAQNNTVQNNTVQNNKLESGISVDNVSALTTPLQKTKLQPVVSQPVVTQPVVTQPVVSQPVSTQPLKKSTILDENSTQALNAVFNKKNESVDKNEQFVQPISNSVQPKETPQKIFPMKDLPMKNFMQSTFSKPAPNTNVNNDRFLDDRFVREDSFGKSMDSSVKSPPLVYTEDNLDSYDVWGGFGEEEERSSALGNDYDEASYSSDSEDEYKRSMYPRSEY